MGRVSEIERPDDQDQISCPNCHTRYGRGGGSEKGVFLCRQCGKLFRAGKSGSSLVQGVAGQVPKELELIGARMGNYRIQQFIGRGRMGIVYLAHDEALLRPTALKILSWKINNLGQDPTHWFLAEARAIAGIRHPGIIQIYNIGKTKSYRFIAMEFVEGKSADELLEEKDGLPFEEATDILIQTAEAIHAAHECGVIHRDVKPSNLLINPKGRVIVTDFGMALHPAGGVDVGPKIRVGTPFYLAPECWRGESASPASDIYSLGATWYRLLTNQYPFEAKSASELSRRHQKDSPPDPGRLNETLPAGCAKLLKKCLAKKPKKRFSSARDLARAAEKLLNKQQKTASPNGENVLQRLFFGKKGKDK